GAGTSAVPAPDVVRVASALLVRLHLGLEGIDIALVDDLGGNDDQLVGRDSRLVALEILGHQLHALIAPFIGLLQHRADDRSLMHAAQRDRVAVEADDLDLAELARLLQHLVDAGRVVGIDADQAVDVRIGGERVLDVALGPRLVDVVAADVDEIDLRALDRVLDALDALAGVVGAGQPDEADALAAIGQRLQHHLAGLLAGQDIGTADIGDAVGLRRIAVGGEERDLRADPVQGL